MMDIYYFEYCNIILNNFTKRGVELFMEIEM